LSADESQAHNFKLGGIVMAAIVTELKTSLQNVIEGRFELDLDGRVFSRDMSKEGWTLLEDEREPWPISIADMELVSFLEEGESYVSGEEMIRRSREELNANLGQRHAEFLLEHQEEIPKEFRECSLIFPRTIWRDRCDCRLVAYLRWCGKRWCLGFGWLGNDFYDSVRLLRPRE